MGRSTIGFSVSSAVSRLVAAGPWIRAAGGLAAHRAGWVCPAGSGCPAGPAQPARFSRFAGPARRVRARRWRSGVGLLTVWLASCTPADFTRPGPLSEAAAAAPNTGDADTGYAEFCAISQIRQKPGIGAEIRGEPGGHAVFYLHGACRSAPRQPTRLALCDLPAAEYADGVGISMNAHFRNAKWVATPGRDFFLDGGMAEHTPLTFARFAAVQDRARQLGLYDGIDFHEWVFEDMPAGLTRERWKYEVSVGTDYAVSVARGRFCARVPVNRAQLAAMVAFLNDQNAPYRDAGAEFEWSLFRDNCIHLAHNALTAAGFRAEWPTNRSWLVSMLDFPVPRNEFVNIMRRGADASLLDPARLHEDAAARRALLEYGQLPVRPGVLAESRGPQAPNEVYDSSLVLLFYDDPLFGWYRRWSAAILADSTQHDPAANRAWIAGLYRQALAARKPLDWWLAQPDLPDRAGFPLTYRRFYALLGERLAALEPNSRLVAASGPVPRHDPVPTQSVSLPATTVELTRERSARAAVTPASPPAVSPGMAQAQPVRAAAVSVASTPVGGP